MADQIKVDDSTAAGLVKDLQALKGNFNDASIKKIIEGIQALDTDRKQAKQALAQRDFQSIH